LAVHCGWPFLYHLSGHLKIAILGDYNFTYNSHQATNMALDHSARFLETDINYYWIKITEAAQFKEDQFREFDGVWLAPGPYNNLFFVHGIIRTLSRMNIPTLITGDGFRFLFEVLINVYQLNPNGEKLISDNLVDGNHFERIFITPNSKQFIQLYENHSNVELTSTRYSLYPQLIQSLENEVIDIEAFNQFEDPEVVSLKNHEFFVACSYCPQISSTREIPHPLIYTFVKAGSIYNTSEIKAG
jgi:CTP synthase (UTP-ammonia lyase)